MIKHSHYLALILYFLSSTTLFCQDNYIVTHLTKDQRANFGDIYSLYEDQKGIIWMGIYGKGLAYYDGERIKRFPLPNEQSFASRDVVFNGFEDYIYLNKGTTITVFDPIQQDIYKTISLTNKQKKIGEITSVAVTRQDDTIYTWAALQINSHNNSNTLYYLLRSKNHENFEIVNNAPIETKGTAFIKGVGQTVFAKAGSGFEVWNVNHKPDFIELSQVPMAIVTPFNFKVDKNNTVWVGGACMLDLERKNEGRLYICDIWKKPINSNTFIESQGYSFEKNMILKTKPYLKKLILINSEHIPFTHYDTNESQPIYNPINLIYTEEIAVTLPHVSLKTKSGIIWWGSLDGLYKLTPQPPAFKLLPAISLRAFIEDEDGYIYGSVDKYSKFSKESSILKYDPMSDNVTSHLQQPYAGGYWYHINAYKDNFFAYSGILDLKTGYNKVLEDVYEDFNSKPFLSLITSKGELWKANWNVPYIVVYNVNTGKRIKKINIDALQSVSISLNDWYQRPSDKTIWLGTFGLGIFVFDESGELLHHFNRKENSKITLVNNIVSSFYEDKKGNMWIGHGSGLTCIDKQLSNSKHYTFDAENPESRLVYGILPEDDDRFLWLSTSKGVFRFNSVSEKFMDFPLHPNVMNYEYNRVSYYKSKKGQLFFGTDRSDRPTVSFFPKDVLAFYNDVSANESQIILTNYKQYNANQDKEITQKRALQAIDEIILNPGDRYFEITFLATDFRSPDHNNYTYYLENYEEDWRPIARENNKVRYENLPPGEYTLKLRGSLIAENIAQNQRNISVIVKPYWYQTLVFKILFSFLFVGIVYMIFRYRMKQEYTKQESIRLQELDRMKTQLYTNITHEFRTPLTLIMGMNENITGHPNERSLIQRNAENLLNLINQLLDLSKLDSNTITYDVIRGDIVVYLQYLTESFYAMATDKKIILQFDSELENLEMDYDEIKIQHIIYNLLSNAIKFTNSGGKVNFSISTSKEESNLIIEIKDTGKGISKEDLPYIFERFYQAGQKSIVNQGVQSYSGTGIGLAITKELITIMKGHIDVQSQIGLGSIFTISLPILNENTSVKETAIVSKQNNIELVSNSITMEETQTNSNLDLVLVIEDNPGIINYIQSIIKGNYDIAIAINGQEGIDKAISLIPDIIISDVMMPEKNGFEVCDQLKNDERTNHIPIIMLTAKADMRSKIEGLDKGADAYMSKPFEKKELLTRLRKLLELRKTLQNHYSKGRFLSANVTTTERIEDTFISKIKSYIELNFQDSELNVSKISNALHLNHSQLYRKLKAVTGMTLSQFIRTIRLNKAIHLLETTDLTIAEIAYEVGFNDPNYFTRTFKKTFNKLPSDLRNVSFH